MKYGLPLAKSYMMTLLLLPVVVVSVGIMTIAIQYPESITDIGNLHWLFAMAFGFTLLMLMILIQADPRFKEPWATILGALTAAIAGGVYYVTIDLTKPSVYGPWLILFSYYSLYVLAVYRLPVLTHEGQQDRGD